MLAKKQKQGLDISDFTQNAQIHNNLNSSAIDFRNNSFRMSQEYEEYDEENEQNLDQQIMIIQKKYSIASATEFQNELKLKEWSEQSKHILLTQLVPTYLSDISQQMIYGFESEVALKTQYLQDQIKNLQLQNGEKQRNIVRLELDINFLKKKNEEREQYYEQKWTEVLKQTESREQQFADISQHKTKYWIERINELTTLFLELKNFMLNVRNHIPREVYMGELFRFKRLFSIEELMEKSIYSQSHKDVWELYHDLETKCRSFQSEKESLQRNVEYSSQQVELKDKIIQRLKMETIEYQKKIDHLEEDNKFYVHEIEEIKIETENISLQLEKQCQEIVIQKNSDLEILNLKYLKALSDQDIVLSEYRKQIQNLENFLSNQNKELLNLKRDNTDNVKEIQFLNESKQRQGRIYEDQIHNMKAQKDSMITTLQKQLESEKQAYDGNKRAIEDIYEQKSKKWQALYKNMIMKIRQF